MTSNALIRKKSINCPLCDKVHEVEERVREAKTMIKEDEITYEEHYFFCCNSEEEENEYVSGRMMNDNLLNARNAYRVKHGLLTSNEIVALRESYGLSQVDLARLMGWGEATISRYESKTIQDEAYDTMLRIIRDNPLQTLDFLNKNKENFSLSKRSEIKKKIIEKLDSYGKEYLTRQAFSGEYVCFEEESDYNGFTHLNIDKIEATISYFASKDHKLFKVKLMKLLWYADAISYRSSRHSITGMVYRHNEMGALPVGHYSLMNLEKLNVCEEESYNHGTMLHIYPSEGMDYGVLSPEELGILDIVSTRFKDFNSKQIIDYMHKERAYKETQQGEIIPFSLAKELNDM